MSEGTLKHLQKMTRTKLIEEAHETHGIQGAHGMNKEQLIEAIAAAMKNAGTWVEVEQPPKAAKKVKKAGPDKAALKKMIRELKKKRDDSLASGDREAFTRARALLGRLKGRLRRAKAQTAG